MGPRFFIDRPVFAWVVALLISLIGLIALRSLPVEQYPSVAPPSLSITATYPGADAATVEQSVTQVIEQELNGVEGLLYMSSTSASNGQGSITATGDVIRIPGYFSGVEDRLSVFDAIGSARKSLAVL